MEFNRTCRINSYSALRAMKYFRKHQKPPLRSHNECQRKNMQTFCQTAATHTTGATQEWVQKAIELPPLSRGCHVITHKLLQNLPEIAMFEVGLVNIFIQHTSASLTLNENASSDVPLDLSDALDRMVPEGRNYRHLDEGYDDMPAHVKSSLMGASLTIPIQSGRLATGIWQGIYLNEHRNYGGPRRLMVTIQGKRRADGRNYGPATQCKTSGFLSSR